MFVVFGGAAVVSALAGAFVIGSRRIERLDRGAVAVAMLLSAAWCAAVAALGTGPRIVQGLEIARNLAWIVALFRHFANDGRDETLRVVRPLVLTLGLVEALQIVLVIFFPLSMSLEVSALLRMLVAVGALVLVHNLFGGASDASRRLLAWNSAGMALLWCFELNLATIAYLTGDSPSGLMVARGIVMAAVAAAFIVGLAQGKSGLAFRPSRAVTFSSLSLAVLSIYLLMMVALANGVARLSQDLAMVTQVGFLLAAATAALLWLPSPHLRARLRVLALKHFFKHRYDYRAEWLRFTQTMGRPAGDDVALQTRAIQALADIADSPAGLLLSPQEDGDLALAARWNWPTADVPSVAASGLLVRLLERHGLILAFDETRGGIDRFGEHSLVPAWLVEEERAWAGIPLLHGERLIGLIVLARPQVARRLDWEDFDLLAIAGRQIASYLAEQESQAALQDAARFDEFNRRIAFVMHDIKNLSSQLGLLARNAERHAENPAFRADMLVTLRNSADKLDALVNRLGRYGRGVAEPVEEIDLAPLARKLAHRHAAAHPVECVALSSTPVLGRLEPLEQALDHLIQNAIEASERGSPVVLNLRHDGLRGEIAVIDSGKGMSPQFIRQSLFRPFVSTKENGFGIGTCEARELVRSMGGRLDVESREGVGSRFTISLPSRAATELIEKQAGRPADRKVDA